MPGLMGMTAAAANGRTITTPPGAVRDLLLNERERWAQEGMLHIPGTHAGGRMVAVVPIAIWSQLVQLHRPDLRAAATELTRRLTHGGRWRRMRREQVLVLD